MHSVCGNRSHQMAQCASLIAPHGDAIAAEAFTAFVRGSNRAMPPYPEAVLSNEDLADIHAYLQSIPKPADYKSIPLLNQ
jgi:mono/diheme cytochrome c family protein